MPSARPHDCDDVLTFRCATQGQRQLRIGMCENNGDCRRRLGGGQPRANCHPKIGGNRQAEHYLHSAQEAAQHHVLAPKVENANLLFFGVIAVLRAQRQRKRVESITTTRPFRRSPVRCCLTPQQLPPSSPGLFARQVAPDRCRNHAAGKSESA